MSESMMEKLKKLKQRQEANTNAGGGSQNFFKPEYGEVKLRFLPAKNGKDVFLPVL